MLLLGLIRWAAFDPVIVTLDFKKQTVIVKQGAAGSSVA
jgi:hypothetical protein